MPRDARELYDMLEQGGASDFRLRIGRHICLKFTLRGQCFMQVFPRTPSDRRGALNKMAEIRRIIRGS